VRFKANDSLRRVFQAIRIEVNAELANLKAILPKALQILSPHGRLVVISFHSLEDRIVKEFFNQEAHDCICPPDFPTCVCDKVSTVRILTWKPVIAAPEEIAVNPRSKPAKLRACEKL
jgi:16S rRNA (cytosine1402-N4)-methyltransferase